MLFEYYIVDKNNMTIISKADNFVSAYNDAAARQFPCSIVQGCLITETQGMNSDINESVPDDNETL